MSCRISIWARKLSITTSLEAGAFSSSVMLLPSGRCRKGERPDSTSRPPGPQPLRAGSITISGTRGRPRSEGLGRFARRSSRVLRMKISARNQIPARVTGITQGEAIANVALDASGIRLVASITVEAVRELGIVEGSQVTAVIKASDVMLGVEA